MAKDIQGYGLDAARRFAGSRFAEKYGLRKPAEKLAYAATKRTIALMHKQLNKRSATKPAQASGATSHLFDLSLNSEQQMIKDTVRSYSSDVLRDLALDADEQRTLPSDFFTQLMALGLNYFSVPEAIGGAAPSYSPTTSAIIAEELAWGDMSLAYAALAPVAVANAVAKWGTPDQQQEYLPRYLSDAPIKAAIAVQEPHPLFRADQLSCQAKKSGDGYVLSGRKSMVPFAGDADLYLVAARLKGTQALFFVRPNDKGVSVKETPAMGLRAAQLCELTLDNVRVDATARLGDDTFDYQAFIDLGQLHWCALAVGTCQAALDYLIPYANERQAFGEPISHRQSVAFLIANIGIEMDAMRLMTWRAASLAERGKPFHREAFLAHNFCAEKAMEIGTNTVQVLGGHGFTKEHPGERWYRDLRVLSCVNSGLHL